MTYLQPIVPRAARRRRLRTFLRDWTVAIVPLALVVAAVMWRAM